MAAAPSAPLAAADATATVPDAEPAPLRHGVTPDAATTPDADPPAGGPDPASGSGPAVPGAAGTARGEMGGHALLLGLGTLASRLLGMARESMIAATFELGATDAFFVAWRIPNALRGMLAEGAARYAFNPVLGDALHGASPDGAPDRGRLRLALARVKGAALLVLLAVTVVGMLAARPIFAAVSGGFDGDHARFELGVSLLRVLFPYLFFMGWFAVGNAPLQLLKKVAPGAFAPIMLNVAFVVAPFALMPLLTRVGVPGIYALAIAALLGGLLQVLWLRPALRREGMLPRPRLVLDATVRRLGVLFLPQVFGQAVYQVNIILSGRLLGGLPKGAASYFNYAQRLADIPQGLFAVALSGAAAIALQRDATRGNRAGAARTYESALRMAAFVALPMTVLLAAYAEAVIPLVYGYGRFRRLGAAGVLEVAASLRWQAVGIAFLAFVHQTTAVFGAFGLRKDIVGAATASVATFGLVGWLATPRMGHAGVALAMAASTVVQLAVLLATVRRVVPVRFGTVGATLAKVLFATGMTALAARAAVRFLPVTGTSAGAKVLAAACGAGLVALYAALAWVLRCDEMMALGEKLRARARRREKTGR